jgi:hypothetical protein
MTNSIPCPSCSRGVQVEAGGRLPPWCRACGASLSRAAAPATATPAPSGERAASIQTSIPQPPASAPGAPAYFHACVPQVLQHERLSAFRFYVTDGELLAFPAGLGSIQDGQFVPQTRVSRVVGGIGYGAGLVSAGQTACELNNLRDAEPLAKLDGSSEAVLAQAARGMHGAVAIPAEDLPRVRIEAAGTWFALTRGFRCAAVLKLGYPGFGPLALPSLTDARRAVEGLTGLLGSSLEVDLPWGARRS